MALRFSTMAGKDSTEPRYYDCTPKLEAEELLSSVTVVSQDTTILTISSVAVTTAIVTKESGTTIGIGKGLTWLITIVKNIVADVDIVITYTGDGNTTAKSVTVVQPVAKTLTS